MANKVIKSNSRSGIAGSDEWEIYGGQGRSPRKERGKEELEGWMRGLREEA